MAAPQQKHYHGVAVYKYLYTRAITSYISRVNCDLTGRLPERNESGPREQIQTVYHWKLPLTTNGSADRYNSHFISRLSKRNLNRINSAAYTRGEISRRKGEHFHTFWYPTHTHTHTFGDWLISVNCLLLRFYCPRLNATATAAAAAAVRFRKALLNYRQPRGFGKLLANYTSPYIHTRPFETIKLCFARAFAIR